MATDRRSYLRHCKGVVHVGASDGAERHKYARNGLNVLWVEPLPDAFAKLLANIAPYENQTAVQALATDRDGDTNTFHLAGKCSSILSPSAISEVLPDVRFTGAMTIISTTLDTIMQDRPAKLYDALVLDTQGAELLVLKGGERSLRRFRYVECEAADFAIYAGYPKPDEIRQFLAHHGFRQVREDTFRTSDHGREFDMLFRRL